MMTLDHDAPTPASQLAMVVEFQSLARSIVDAEAKIADCLDCTDTRPTDQQ